jgi:hypothetical protein
MTKENSQTLYLHYVKIGYDKAAEDLLRKYPDFAEIPKEAKKEEIKKSK